jgi:hypothetical protein
MLLRAIFLLMFISRAIHYFNKYMHVSTIQMYLSFKKHFPQRVKLFGNHNELARSQENTKLGSNQCCIKHTVSPFLTWAHDLYCRERIQGNQNKICPDFYSGCDNYFKGSA